MTLQARIESLLTRLAAEFKTLHGQIGALDALSTTEKGSLVGAINDLRSQITAIGGGTTGTVIDDSNTGATATTLSASKIVSLLGALKAELLGGADAAFDTLKELADALAADKTGLEALLTALEERVRVEDVGNIDADLVAVFEQALTATTGDTPADSAPVDHPSHAVAL